MKQLMLFALLCISSLYGFSQVDSLRRPPYQRFPTTPPLKLLLSDSTSWFTKENVSRKKAVMIMLFSPDCEHCKRETEALIQHIDAFKNVQIVMATTLPFEKMKEFKAKYDLGRFGNIVVGQDVSHTLPIFYEVRNLPFLAFYNKKKELISVFEGALPIEKVIAEFDK